MFVDEYDFAVMSKLIHIFAVLIWMDGIIIYERRTRSWVSSPATFNEQKIRQTQSLKKSIGFDETSNFWNPNVNEKCFIFPLSRSVKRNYFDTQFRMLKIYKIHCESLTLLNSAHSDYKNSNTKMISNDFQTYVRQMQAMECIKSPVNIRNYWLWTQQC